MQEHQIFHIDGIKKTIANYLDTNDQINFIGLLSELGIVVPEKTLDQLEEENAVEIKILKQKIDEKNRDEKYQGFFRSIELQNTMQVLTFFNLMSALLLRRYLERPEENTDNNDLPTFWQLTFIFPVSLFLVYSLDPIKDLLKRYNDYQSHKSASKNATEDLKAKENQSIILEKIKTKQGMLGR